MARIQLYVPARLEAGRTLELEETHAHYLGRVMRLKEGDEISLFNGHDGEWTAEIITLGKKGCKVTITGQVRAQRDEPDVWLAFSPLKKARTDFVIEKATELGVSKILPVFTEFTDTSRVNQERLQTTAIEAAEQSERLSIPEVLKPVKFRDLADLWPPDRLLFVMDETGRAPQIGDVLRDTEAPGPWGVLIGPEGGFAPGELDALGKLSFAKRVGLGPRVLRAETAAVAALSVFQAFWGDWHHPRGQ